MATGAVPAGAAAGASVEVGAGHRGVTTADVVTATAVGTDDRATTAEPASTPTAPQASDRTDGSSTLAGTGSAPASTTTTTTAATTTGATTTPTPTPVTTAPIMLPGTPFAPTTMLGWRAGPGGSSTMSVEVDTETLGQVRVRATELDGGVRLSLQSDDAAGRSILHERLPELRRDLVEAGIDHADLDVAQRDPHRHGERAPAEGPRLSPTDHGTPVVGDGPILPTAPAPTPSVPGRLDLRL
jgi:flagellar hook-length control protein FliK